MADLFNCTCTFSNPHNTSQLVLIDPDQKSFDPHAIDRLVSRFATTRPLHLQSLHETIHKTSKTQEKWCYKLNYLLSLVSLLRLFMNDWNRVLLRWILCKARDTWGSTCIPTCPLVVSATIQRWAVIVV